MRAHSTIQGPRALYEKNKDKGFEILAFPANEFGAEEPGTNDEIKEFCSTKYKVSFPLFSKIVVLGKGIDPLYDYLTSKETNPKFAGNIPGTSPSSWLTGKARSSLASSPR